MTTVDMSPTRVSHRRAAFLILALYIILALLYSMINPIWEAPDEVGHFNFIRHLRKSGTLPKQKIGNMGENHQPPLYYLLAASATLPADMSGEIGALRQNPQFIWAAHGGNEVNISFHSSAETFPYRQQSLALHLARLTSLLMGFGTVILTMKIGWELFPEIALIGLLAGALVAFNPQFLFISGSINNDNLLILAATGAIWQTLRALKRPFSWKQWFYAGVWVSIAILTKLSGLVIGAMVGLALLAVAIYQRSIKLFVKDAVALAVPSLILTGWWFVRNQILYGDPLGLRVYQEVFAANLRQAPLRWHDIQEFLSIQFRSFWGVFGWMNLPSPEWHILFVRVLLWASLVGLIIFLAKKRYRQLARERIIGLLFLTMIIVIQEGYMLTVITGCNTSCYQGRYLFPVIGPMMVFVSLGQVNLVPISWRKSWSTCLVLLLIAVAIWIPFRVISPAYQMPTLSNWQLWFVPNQTNINFAEPFGLRGYDIQQKDNNIELTLYWKAVAEADFDYSAFVHLINESGEIIAQKDGSPGESINYLPTVWQTGDILHDTRLLELPPDLPAGIYRFRIGVYNWASGERLPAFEDGEFAGDFVVLTKPYTR